MNSNPPGAQFIAWGKREPGDGNGGGREHPLTDHMCDVAECFRAICRCKGVHSALASTAGYALDRIDLERLAVLAYLHDLGKANSGFQGRRWSSADLPSGWPEASGHSNEALFLFEGESALSNDLVDELPCSAIASWGDAASGLLRASISHHGRPVYAVAAGFDTQLWQPVVSDGVEVYSPRRTLAEIGEQIQKLFPLAFTQLDKPLPTAPAFAHLFAGLVQLADWLGSDTRFFPFSEPGEDRTSKAATRAAEAVRTIGLDVGALRAPLEASIPDFTAVFDVVQARPIQKALGEPALGPLLILEAETGSGKTEAALWRFVQLFRSGAVDGLYFALPTRVAASQLYERLRRFVTRLWPAGGAIDTPVVVRALPGYASADGQELQRLPAFRVLWADRAEDREAHRRWAAESPKRYLAATIAVGTVDQALLGALQVRHAHLRHALLARSLLVVDEVHASDAYMSTLLEHLLTAHRRAGGHALLLSATLGAVARARYQALVDNLPDGTNVPRSPRIPPLRDACDLPYPALSDGPRLTGLPGTGQVCDKVVRWHTQDCIDDPSRVAALAVEAAGAGARVLVVRNTVPAAIATLQSVEALVDAQGHTEWLLTLKPQGGGAPVSTLHHSRFSRQDRPLIDAAVEAHLGKKRKHPGGCIVIGTQTLEQSLDLDADLLITDLCPMDVLLQRIGRLHRHVRPDTERPLAYRSAQAVVLVPTGGDLSLCLKRARHGLGVFRSKTGISGVYPDLRMLEATRRLINAQPNRAIPRDNRELVERATHPEALMQIEYDCGAEWAKLGQDLAGSFGAARSVANLHALPYDQPFEDLSFPNTEQHVATRLGAADRVIEFDPPVAGPFGQPVRQISVRFHLLPPDLAPNVQPTNVVLLQISGGGFEFTLGERRYRYSRFGLERLPEAVTPNL
jgi:CRISPR-associated endonuclease/helicase Cas3